MHKSTAEILSRRAGEASGLAVKEDNQIVVIAILGSSKTYEVRINEAARSFEVVTPAGVAESTDPYRVRDWREALYAEAIGALKDAYGRLAMPLPANIGPGIVERSGAFATVPNAWMVRRVLANDCVVISAVGEMGEQAHATIDMASGRFWLGLIPQALTEDQTVQSIARDGGVEAACDVLSRISSDRARCVVLGDNETTNQNCLRAALRMGFGRFVVIGGSIASLVRSTGMMIDQVEFFPPDMPYPTGDVMLIDARKMAAAV